MEGGMGGGMGSMGAMGSMGGGGGPSEYKRHHHKTNYVTILAN